MGNTHTRYYFYMNYINLNFWFLFASINIEEGPHDQ
jgi:hypothetical protein